MQLLPVKNFRQSPSHCGPTCLKMVFAYYGVDATERSIAKVAGTTLRLGTKLQGLRKAAQQFDFKLKHKDLATFADIKHCLHQGVPPIAAWFSVNDAHYSVVVGLDAQMIYLRDPEFGRLTKMPRKTFFRVWFDFTGDYLKTPHDLHLRRLITVTPKKIRP